MSSISELKAEISPKKLTKKDVSPDPFKQFSTWFEETIEFISGEPNAMILSTADSSGKPSSRVVLLKGFSDKGFLFFTNYNSRKGSELVKNPHAALLFFWGELERQIRIEGSVVKVSRDQSREYFHSRPRLSQIGALASSQSEVVKDRSVLEEKFRALEKELEGKIIPAPVFWGGFSVMPEYFEFWQGRQNRLHDRISYRLNEGKWIIERLSP